MHAIALRKRADSLAHAAPIADPSPESSHELCVSSELVAETGTIAHQAFSASTPARRRNAPRAWRAVVGVVLAVLIICGAAGISGSMWWTHRNVVERQQRTAEFMAAARSSITGLMSIDFTKARDDVQRVIDTSTGQFKDQFQASADDLIAALEQSKVNTTVTVDAVAVKEVTDDSAVVLVTATSRASSVSGPHRDPQIFRVVLTLERDRGQLKMSRVEFAT